MVVSINSICPTRQKCQFDLKVSKGPMRLVSIGPTILQCLQDGCVSLSYKTEVSIGPTRQKCQLVLLE